LPDIRFEILDSLSEGDRVAARLRVTGTHTGAGLPIEPQGQRFTITGATGASSKPRTTSTCSRSTSSSAR
jgi:hypothetical protein